MQESLKRFPKIEVYHICGLYLLASFPTQNKNILIHSWQIDKFIIFWVRDTETMVCWTVEDCSLPALPSPMNTTADVACINYYIMLYPASLCHSPIWGADLHYFQCSRESQGTAQIFIYISQVKQAKNIFASYKKIWATGIMEWKE